MDISNLKKFIREIVKFKGIDSRAILMLVFISFLFTFLNLSGRLWNQHTDISLKELELGKEEPIETIDIPEVKTKTKLFSFDPNTVSIDELILLGIPEKTAKTIEKYRSKGGHFYKNEDLKKIYSLKEADYKRLQDYIVIKGVSKTKSYENKENYVKKIESQWTIDINKADEEAFERLNGIGPYFAKRIVKFREKLGGFYKIEQVAETYGIEDSVFQKFKHNLSIGVILLQQINVNKADFQLLDAHPYINKKLAEEIVRLREKLGKIEEIESLHSLKNWEFHSFEKVKPYLKISD